MSILPLPDLTPQAPSNDISYSVPTIRLSALDAYAGHPNALAGVSFWPRVAARMIDLAAHYIIGFLSGALMGLMIVIAANLQHARGAALAFQRSEGRLVLYLFSILGAIALESICEGFHGSTLGKLLLGFAVVQEDGTPCRPASAVIRSLAYYLDAIFFGLVGYLNMQKTPQQQRHGDEWAHTIVCRRSEVAPHNLRGVDHFAMVFLLAAMANAALAMIGLLIRRIA